MKKFLLSSITLLMIVLIAGCGTTEESEEITMLADGEYYAIEDNFSEYSGWKDYVEVTIVDGKISKVNWSGEHKDGGNHKKDASKNGEYQMVENGGAQAAWFEQAMKVETYLIEQQDPSVITYSDDEGHTDVISGASINVKGFFTLVQKALDDGPK